MPQIRNKNWHHMASPDARIWSLASYLPSDKGMFLQASCEKKSYITLPGNEKTWLVVSTHLKNISQNGNLPQIGVKIKNI